MLSAIVCPLTPRELPAALKNLEFWDGAMAPLIHPEAEAARPKLVFSFNGASDETLSRPLIDEFDQREAVKRSFEALEVRFCDLPPEKDLYVREGEIKYAPFGNKSGPNWLFFETMKALKNEARFVFLMETDCQPVVPNWIRKIQKACAQNDDAWIVGSHYCGASPLHWSIARHINGNALYHVGDPQFWAFLETRFWPWLNDYIVKSEPNLAYDCGWETYLNRPEMEHAGSYEWVRTRDILQRFRLSNFVVNIGGRAEQTGEYAWTRADILKRFPGAAIVHGPLAPSTAHKRGKLAFGRAFVDGAATLDDKGLHVESDLEGASFRRSMWLPDQPLDEHCEVAVAYDMDCANKAGLQIELREPSGRLIGRRRYHGPKEGGLRKGKFVQAIGAPLPYVRIGVTFHGPEGARIDVPELRCGVSRNGELCGQTNRVLSD